MRDPYSVLGIDRSASETEIKHAYRRHAKRLHPDMHDGDAALEARFQEIQAAYALLKDRARRQQFDAGEIDANGNPRAPSFEDALRAARAQKDYEATAGRAQKEADSKQARQDRDNLFSEFLSTFRKARRHLEPESIVEPNMALPPVKLALTFSEAVTGTRKTLALPSGKRIAITVPPGAEDGQTIKMRNASSGNTPNMVPVELSVILEVAPDPRFVRDGYDLVATLPITLDEALLGAKVRLDAPSGELLITVPRGGNTGTVLKLKGRGFPKGDGEAGDLLLTLALKLPPTVDSELEALIRNWAARHPYSVRD